MTKNDLKPPARHGKVLPIHILTNLMNEGKLTKNNYKAGCQPFYYQVCILLGCQHFGELPDRETVQSGYNVLDHMDIR